MKSTTTALLLAVSILAVSCSSGADDPVVPSPGSVVTVPSTTDVSVDRKSTIADLVVPGESALYDPADHRDGGPAPISISIGGIDVDDAPVVDVGVETDGDMEVPGAEAVGWYRFNPTPGQEGSAVLAAHIAYNGSPGVFRHLADVDIGAMVLVGFDDGSTAAFQIVELAQYDKEELPTDRIFAKTGEPVLTLITCGGSFNESLRSYDDNVVAYAVPVADS